MELPEPRDPDSPMTPAPGLIAGIGAIVAGVIGFCIPVLGMAVSCVGIWLGIKAIRDGRAARYPTSTTCGFIGAAISVLGIVFWVCAFLFESYR
jgi:hypothetical protein